MSTSVEKILFLYLTHIKRNKYISTFIGIILCGEFFAYGTLGLKSSK